MPVVQIGKVPVAVNHRLMPVPMRVRLTGLVCFRMRVMVVLIMGVPVLMEHFAMRMLMVMVFGQVKPHAESHQGTGNQQSGRQRLA